MPDWKNSGQYPDAQKTKPFQWAWEFLRRSPDYRDLWMSQIGPMRFLESDAQTIQDFGKRFGILGIPPPPWSSSKYPRFETIRTEIRPVAWPQEREPYLTEAKPLAASDAVVWFDLRFPLLGQLDRAKRLLQLQSRKLKAAGELPKAARPREEHYQSYLRLLDANEVGATRQQIAKEIHSKIVNNPNFSASHRVRDSLRAAIKLRDYDYRSIAAGAGK